MATLEEVINQKASRELEAIDRKNTANDNYVRSFKAAQFNNLNTSWIPSLVGPKAQSGIEAQTVRGRARDLYENSPIIRNYVSLLQNNVVGPKGFGLKSTVKNSRGKVNTKIANKIEAAWALFCESPDASGRYSMTELLDQMVYSLSIQGEILLRKRYKDNYPYGFKIKLLHPEQLPLTVLGIHKQGVELDEDDCPLSYLLYKGHPGDAGEAGTPNPHQEERVLADKIIHAFIPHEPGAVRGFPLITASMQHIKNLDGYFEAEVTAARLGAIKAYTYKQASIDGLDVETQQRAMMSPGLLRGTVTPGSVEVLPPGVELQAVQSEHPTTAFPDYVRANQKTIAAGVGLTYNTLFSDYENTSFSSMRAAFTTDSALYYKLQQFIITKVLNPIFEAWLDVACGSGVLDLPPIMGSWDYLKEYEFIGKPIPFSNPLQEAEAQALLLEKRLISRTQLCAERGTTYAEVLRDMANEAELEAASGLNFAVLPTASSVQVVPEDQEPATDPIDSPMEPNNEDSTPINQG